VRKALHWPRHNSDLVPTNIEDTVPASATPSISPFGERALLLAWEQRIDPALNAEVHACAARLRADAPDWIEDIVPAYCSLAVVLDVDRCLALAIDVGIAAAWLRTRLQQTDDGAAAVGRLVEIPVVYGGDDGPDLDAVAQAAGLAREEVIARHSAVEYRVGLLGFAPGFPYLLGLDPALAVPRRATPRTAVPAGSVGIGGAQTGIYPRRGPGGWQLIGRTRLALFDPQRDPPSLLVPGDRLRFVARPPGAAG
jgi:KipI family sensor histidine kinase inhibitor